MGGGASQLNFLACCTLKSEASSVINPAAAHTHQSWDRGGQGVIVAGSLTQRRRRRRRRPTPTSASSQGGRLSLSRGQARLTWASSARGQSEPESSPHAHFILFNAAGDEADKENGGIYSFICLRWICRWQVCIRKLLK